jgi:hypothetical protein
VPQVQVTFWKQLLMTPPQYSSPTGVGVSSLQVVAFGCGEQQVPGWPGAASAVAVTHTSGSAQPQSQEPGKPGGVPQKFELPGVARY